MFTSQAVFLSSFRAEIKCTEQPSCWGGFRLARFLFFNGLWSLSNLAESRKNKMDPCTCNTCGPLGDPAWHLPLGPHDCGSAQGPAGPLGCHLPPKREVPARPHQLWYPSHQTRPCLVEEELYPIQMFIIQTSWSINAKIYENADVALSMIQECEV